jgi:hypothetical protein
MSTHMGAFGPPRFGAGTIATALQLGPLASLRGSWAGGGFNAIWRPDNEQPPENSKIKRFLELNLTSETFEFRAIPGVVPNRGFATQPDLGLYGLHYLQRVSDADKPPFSTAGQALHLEPGLFMNVPASQVPQNEPSIVRLATIPHGVAVLMQGPTPSATPRPGPPHIPAVYPIPGLPNFIPGPTALGLGIQPVDIPQPGGGGGAEHVVPEVDIANDGAGSQSNGPYPPEFQGYVNDPNSLLREVIAGQEILGTIAIELSTEGVGSGIENIPFLGIANPVEPDNPTTPNAFVHSAAATFWIEWVRDRSPHPLAQPPQVPGPAGLQPGADGPSRSIEPFWDEPSFLQLQYTQTVILIFNEVLWPHVTVATLRLSAG